MNKIITENINRIEELCVNHHVNSLYAFGSVCTDKFSDASDIDLLISFEPMDYGDYADNYFYLADQFENIFNRPVDLLTDKSLANPYFIDSVNQTKALIYGQ
ncbi:MAG: putative nucleotidyltransferase [Cyclobacteriaceae bacterium]|jgi:predicted nucleotidyltransferase